MNLNKDTFNAINNLLSKIVTNGYLTNNWNNLKIKKILDYIEWMFDKKIYSQSIKLCFVVNINAVILTSIT